MKILIVEDEHGVQRVYHRMIGSGHEVIVVGDPIEAWQAIQTGFKPDVIISDWDMPQMNGGEFCRTLRAGGDTTPFLHRVGTRSHPRECRVWSNRELHQAADPAGFGQNPSSVRHAPFCFPM